MASAACTTYAHLGAVRFLQGFFESSLYSGTIYMLGSWYKPSEIAKRTAIFTAIGQIGSMAAGVMMTAMNRGLSGSRLSGWQCVFLVNGAMGIPFGLFGLVFFPNLPESTTSLYLSGAELQLAIARLPPKKKAARSLREGARALLSSPHLWILTGYSLLATALEAFVLQGLFLLYLKAHASRFPAHAPTTYPLGIQAVSIVSNIAAGYIIDATAQRLPMVLLTGVFQLISASLLLVRDIPTPAAFFAFYLAGTSYIVNPLLYGWASVICQRAGDDAQRSVVLYAMSLVQAVLYTFWGVVLYPATDAPYWRNGCIAMIVVVFAFFAGTGAVVWVSFFFFGGDVVVGMGMRLTRCSLIGGRGGLTVSRVGRRRRRCRPTQSGRGRRCIQIHSLHCTSSLIYTSTLLLHIRRHNLSHILRRPLSNRHRMLQAEPMRPLARLIDLHNRLPRLTPVAPGARLDQPIARLVRNPVILLRKQEPQRRARVLVLARRRSAPDLVVPEICVDLEHFVAGHVQRLLDADGGFDEGGGGAGGVGGESEEPFDQRGEQGERDEEGPEAGKDGGNGGEFGVFEERL
jgi:ACS family pantothenate transporter-like MFS transporter